MLVQAIGAGLPAATPIALGARKWLSRPRDGDGRSVPGGMTSLDSATPGKAAVRVYMVDNSNAITVVILLILGVKVFGDGLAGLGQ